MHYRRSTATCYTKLFNENYKGISAFVAHALMLRHVKYSDNKFNVILTFKEKLLNIRCAKNVMIRVLKYEYPKQICRTCIV